VWTWPVDCSLSSTVVGLMMTMTTTTTMMNDDKAPHAAKRSGSYVNTRIEECRILLMERYRPREIVVEAGKRVRKTGIEFGRRETSSEDGN
jgi:plastocyanin domain-containing protein